MGLPKDCGLELHHKWKSGKLNKITDVKGLMREISLDQRL